MTPAATRARFQKRLDSLEPTVDNLERIAKVLGEKKDSRMYSNSIELLQATHSSNSAELPEAMRTDPDIIDFC